MDLRIASFQLYSQDVLIKIKAGSDAFSQHGAYFRGFIVGRIWGDYDISDAKGKFPCDSTVVALTIRTPDKDIEIACNDIESISAANSNVSADFHRKHNQNNNL